MFLTTGVENSQTASGGRSIGISHQIVRQAMHQDNRRFFSRIFSDEYPMFIPLYESLLVSHHFLRNGCHLSSGTSRTLELLMIKHKPICASAAWAFGGDKILHRSPEEEADFSEVKDQYHVLGILVGL